MEITGNFKNGTIRILNLKTDEGEHKCHFNFDVNISTSDLSYSYHFGETLYIKMYHFLDCKQEKLSDENCQDNYLELTKDYFAICTNQDGLNSVIQLHFDKFKDRDILEDFLIELKAVCEYLMNF